jgi:enoyl-CoA hydratase
MEKTVTDNLSCEQIEEHIALFKINRPDALNAMRFAFLEDALALLEALNGEKGIRCVILTGEGEKSFSAGGDLHEEMRNAADHPEEIRRYNEYGYKLVLGIMNHRLPFISAVNGYTFGAPMALIAASDISIASEKAIFALPTCSFGGIPGWGCTQIVARLIGPHNIKRLLLTNERIDAAEALRMGFLSKVVPHDELMPVALRYAKKIASFPAVTMSSVKQTVNEGLNTTLQVGFDMENEALKRLNTSPVFAEGIAAFFEKRAPRFDEICAE